MTLSDILKVEGNTAFAIALSDIVSARCEIVGFEGLRLAEQVAWCIDGLERDVNRGGFERFFANGPGDHARETVAALRTIGATHTARLLEQSMAVFPDGPSPNRDVRGAQIKALSKDARATLDRLTAQFFEYRDDLAALLRAHVASHQSDFE